MDIGGLIQTYGYPAVADSVLIESQTVPLAAGAGASRNYLRMPAVIPVATVCDCSGVRAMYGLRVTGAIAVGMSHSTWSRFFELKFVGAVVPLAVAWRIAVSLRCWTLFRRAVRHDHACEVP